MNIQVFKLKNDICLFDKSNADVEAKKGAHIIVVGDKVYLKKTQDSFSVELNLLMRFIERNQFIFAPVVL